MEADGACAEAPKMVQIDYTKKKTAQNRVDAAAKHDPKLSCRRQESRPSAALIYVADATFDAREVYGDRSAQIVHKLAARASLPVMPFGMALQTALCSRANDAIVEVFPGVKVPLAMTVLTRDASYHSHVFEEAARADVAPRRVEEIEEGEFQQENLVQKAANPEGRFIVASIDGYNSDACGSCSETVFRAVASPIAAHSDLPAALELPAGFDRWFLGFGFLYTWFCHVLQRSVS